MMQRKNIHVGLDFGNVSPEDRIRQLLSHGADPETARATSEILDFTNQNGPNVNTQQLGQFLSSRGHRVNYTR